MTVDRHFFCAAISIFFGGMTGETFGLLMTGVLYTSGTDFFSGVLACSVCGFDFNGGFTFGAVLFFSVPGLTGCNFCLSDTACRLV